MPRLPAFLLALCLPAAAPATTPSVFDASPAWPAPFVERLKPAPAGNILRRLTVEERVGEARLAALVRVPLFLHADEPGDPAAWAIFAADDPQRLRPLPFQLDDIRRDEAGRLTRCHLYFEVSLAPWQRRQFHLVPTAPATAPTAPPALRAEATATDITLAGDDLSVTFRRTGPRAGALTALTAAGHALELPDGWLGPALTLLRQKADCSLLRRTAIDYADPASFEVREVRWGTGPLFAKFAVRIGPPGVPDEAEFAYLVPRRGAVLIQTERLAPAGPPQAEVVGAEQHRLLAGTLRLGNDTRVVRVPAGLRHTTRATNGHFLDALVDTEKGIALLPVPAVQTGGGAIRQTGADRVEIAGAPTFRRNPDAHSGTLRAFWGELRYAFTTATDTAALWHLARRELQPLVAIVDQPELGPADCRAAMPALAERFLEIQYWGRNWQQDAAIHWLHRNRPRADALLTAKPAPAETDPAFHLPKWARSSPPSPRDPKDQGRIDPYHLGYGASLLPLFRQLAPNDRQAPAARAIGLASRQVHGRVNHAGWPYIDCFATAFNMQLGPLGLALFGGLGAEDPALATWARDALRAPGVTGIYGHGQRPYPGEIRRAGPSDLLYECICDLQLRSLELATGEDLALHPAALGRYLDCVDVTADLLHRDLPGAEPRSWARANFFRGQAHDHRWELWSAAPLLGLFAHAADKGEIGSTEAAYWLVAQGQRKQPWAELMWYAHTDLLLATVEKWQPLRPGPPLPANLRLETTAGANRLTWSASPGAVGYRIYRAEHDGGPWRWLNSPYTGTPASPTTGTSFTDPDPSGADYFVTAVDADGRESNWEPSEPKR